ncbi:MAG: hypothetical protein Q7R47_05685 [Candidatus Diapherotrites archaeon]|nr:hypothetical protein [Candidatus Diapherotrites archaeon]
MPDSDWPTALTANAGTVSSLTVNKKAKLDISAAYSGDQNARYQGTALVIVRGYVVGKYPTVAQSRLTVSYNQPLDSNCLEFSPNNLTVYLAANGPNAGVDTAFSPNQYYSNYGNYNATSPTYFGNASPTNQQYYQSQMDPTYQGQFDAANQNGTINSSFDNQYGTYGNGTNPQYSPQYAQYNSPNVNGNNSPYNGMDPQYNPQYGNQYSSQNNNPYSSYNYAQPSNYYAPYSNQYNSYDNQQKDIEMQVKNNCDVALNLSGSAARVGSTTPDQFLQVTVPPISIEPNATTTTTVTVRNTSNRIVSQQETRNYDITYSYNPQLAKIPLKVVLWDSRYALSMPDNIVMYLSQGQKGEPVVSSQPVFIRNVGLEDIQNFNLSLSGDTYNNGVDVRIVPFGGVPVLGKNQVVYPPKLIVAELRGGTEKGRLVRQQLVATGTIDGQQIELRRTNVWISVSAYECLRITPAESLDFISSEAQFGVIDKKIRVRNTCEEAVRVVDVQPNRLGANVVSLVPIATEVLAPNAEAEFLVRLVKRADYKSQNLNLSVAGFTMVSRKFIASNRIKAIVELGRTSVSTGAATEPYTMNICNEDGTISTQTTQVQFPKIATTANCDKAYCDAEQAAAYLVKKLDQKVAAAQQAVGYGNGEVLNFKDNCIVSVTKPTCTFGELDPKIPETFDLFLQNDRLTPDLMQKVLLDKGGADLRNYTVNYCAGGHCDAQTIAATGYPNLLLVSDNLIGCGRFRVSIDGAAFVNQTQIRNTGFTLAVNVSSYENTPECTNRIENVSNFLPIDKGVTQAGGLGTYMGTAQAETKYLPLADAFAKEFYGTSENRVFENAPGNKILVDTGEVPGGIIKVSLASFGNPQDPKTVLATVNRSIEGVDLTQNTQSGVVVKEAASAMASLKSHTIAQGKGCISPNHDYFVLGAASKLGELVLSGDEKVNVAPQAEECVDVTVSSELKENVHVTSNAQDVLTGSNAFSKIILKKKIDATELGPMDTLVLDVDPASKKYQKAFLVCVTGSPWFVFSQSAPKISVSAQSVSDALRKSPDKEIGYKVCGIHPIDFVNKLGTLSPGTYYATLGWKGEPDTTKLCEVVNTMSDKKQLSSDVTFLCNGVASGNQKAPSDALKKQRLDAIWNPKSPIKGYLPSCLATSIACNSMLTLGAGAIIGGPVFDCVLPALWAAAPNIGGLSTARKWLEGAFDNVLGKIGSRVANLLGKTLPGNESDTLRTDYLDGALGSESARLLLTSGIIPKTSFFSYKKYTGMWIGQASAQISKDVAAQAADSALVDFAKGKALGVADPEELRKAFSLVISDELQPLLKKELEAQANKGGFVAAGLGRQGVALSNEKAVEAATQAALAKAQPEIQKKLYALATSPAYKDLMLQKAKVPSPMELKNAAVEKFKASAAALEPAENLDDAKVLLKNRIMTEMQASYGLTEDARVGGLQKMTVADIAEAVKKNQLAELGLKDTDIVLTNSKGAFTAKQIADAVNNDKLTVNGLKNATLTTVEARATLSDVVDTRLALAGTSPIPSDKFNKFVKIGDPEGVYRGVLTEIEKSPEIWNKSIGKGITSDAEAFTKAVLEGKTGSVSNWAKARGFLTSAAKGLACGYASNLAGLWAYNSMASKPVDIPGPQLSLTSPAKPDPQGGLLANANGTVDTGTELQNGVTYKIVVTVDKDKKKTAVIAKVPFATDIPKDTPKESWLNADCTGAFGFKDLSGVLDEAAINQIKIDEQKKTEAKTKAAADVKAKAQKQQTQSKTQFDTYKALQTDPKGIMVTH